MRCLNMKNVKALTFAGILASIHIVATLLLRFEVIPGIEFIILFFVPFFSAYYSYKANWKQLLIYFVSTLAICLVLDYISTLLYILPTLVTGSIYGILVKKKFAGMNIIYTLTIVETALFYLSALIIKGLVGGVYFDVIANIFHLKNKESAVITFGLIFVYSFMQSFLLHYAMKYQLKKLKVEVKKAEHPSFIVLVLALVSFIAVFLPMDEQYFVLSMCSFMVFGSAICLFGYQYSGEKIIWVLFAQAVCFLIIALPLMKLGGFNEGYKALVPYLTLFVPPLGLGIYKLFKDSFIKKEA